MQGKQKMHINLSTCEDAYQDNGARQMPGQGEGTDASHYLRPEGVDHASEQQQPCQGTGPCAVTKLLDEVLKV